MLNGVLKEFKNVLFANSLLKFLESKKVLIGLKKAFAQTDFQKVFKTAFKRAFKNSFSKRSLLKQLLKAAFKTAFKNDLLNNNII